MSDELVPAFESAVPGLQEPGETPILVPKEALETVNREIAKNDKDAKKFAPEALAIAAQFARRALRPDEIAAMRRKMFNIVDASLVDVQKVLDGKKVWTAAQVRLFGILSEKIIPKLATISTDDGNKQKKLEDLSIEELESIALNKKKVEAVDAIMVEAKKHDEAADAVERREGRKEIIGVLANIDAIDEVAKRYVAKKIGGGKGSESSPKNKKKVWTAGPENLSNVEHWINQGMTREEAEERERQRVEKIKRTKAHTKAMKLARLGYDSGMGEARKLAVDMKKRRRAVMDEFRVHNSKGLRQPTTLQKNAEKRRKAAEKFEEKRNNPRVRVGMSLAGFEDMTEEQRRNVRLKDLRERRPDLFEKAKKEQEDQAKHLADIIAQQNEKSGILGDEE